jgi:hypothetical protein
VALGDAEGWPTSRALTVAFALTCAAGVVGVFASRRLPARLPG